MSNKCPVCLKEFESRKGLRHHMTAVGHTIDGHKALARESDEARMAAYHRDKSGDKVQILRYGK